MQPQQSLWKHVSSDSVEWSRCAADQRASILCDQMASFCEVTAFGSKRLCETKQARLRLKSALFPRDDLVLTKRSTT